MTEREKRFDWPLCYEAENLVLRYLDAFLSQHSFANTLGSRMRDETGTLFIDWVDHLVMPPPVEPELRKVGYQHEHGIETSGGQRAFWHPEAMLPRVLLDPTAGQNRGPSSVALRVDSVADFFAIHDLPFHVHGTPMTRYRKAVITQQGGLELAIVERRGYRGYVPIEHAPTTSAALLKAHELWRTRNRSPEHDNFDETYALLDELVSRVGRDAGCHVVFAEERLFWERRNRAGQVQKRRHDRL